MLLNAYWTHNIQCDLFGNAKRCESCRCCKLMSEKIKVHVFCIFCLGDLQSRWVSGQEQWPAVSSSVPSDVPM